VFGLSVTRIAHQALGTTLRHWPFANGAGALLERWGGRLDAGSGERTVGTNDGFDMAVIADDFIGRRIVLLGGFDRSIGMTLVAFGEPGDRIVDIGANIGYMSALYLTHIADSHVDAVEPQADIADLLERNLRPFGSHRYALHRVGLSDVAGEALFHIVPTNRGGSKIVETPDAHTISVPVIEASAFFAKLDRLDLMKIDIEGHEEPVFRSARDAIARLQPRAILFEDHVGRASPAGGIGALLGGIGYRVHGVHKTMFRNRLVPIDADNAGRYHDFVAISQSRQIPAAARALIG
jgi:FkbM family methyltransferase